MGKAEDFSNCCTVLVALRFRDLNPWQGDQTVLMGVEFVEGKIRLVLMDGEFVEGKETKLLIGGEFTDCKETRLVLMGGKFVEGKETKLVLMGGEFVEGKKTGMVLMGGEFVEDKGCFLPGCQFPVSAFSVRYNSNVLTPLLLPSPSLTFPL